MILYTDGSYNKKISPHATAYAAVIVTDITEKEYIVDIIYGVNTDLEYVSMWNVGGEIWAVLTGIDYILNEYKENVIDIYFDYIGLGQWALNKWKAKNTVTKAYQNYMNNKMNEAQISLNKVSGHSGILLNDIADRYANSGTTEYLKSGKTSTLIKNIHILRK